MLSLTEHSKMTVSYLTIKRHNKQEKFNVMLPARFRFFFSLRLKNSFQMSLRLKNSFQTISSVFLGIFFGQSWTAKQRIWLQEEAAKQLLKLGTTTINGIDLGKHNRRSFCPPN